MVDGHPEIVFAYHRNNWIVSVLGMGSFCVEIAAASTLAFTSAGVGVCGI